MKRKQKDWKPLDGSCARENEQPRVYLNEEEGGVGVSEQPSSTRRGWAIDRLIRFD